MHEVSPRPHQESVKWASKIFCQVHPSRQNETTTCFCAITLWLSLCMVYPSYTNQMCPSDISWILLACRFTSFPSTWQLQWKHPHTCGTNTFLNSERRYIDNEYVSVMFDVRSLFLLVPLDFTVLCCNVVLDDSDAFLSKATSTLCLLRFYVSNTYLVFN